MDPQLFAKFRALEERHWWFVARREIVIALATKLAPHQATLLDVGCGTGFFLARAKQHFSVVGLDPSPVALALCSDIGLDCTMLGTATDLSGVGEQRFDIVTLLDVIEHVDDDVAALRAAAGVLKPGGRVIVTVPAFQFLWSGHDDVNHHKRRYTRRGLEKAMRQGGLDQLYLTYFNCYLFPMAVGERLAKRALGLDKGADLALPPRIVNAAMQRIFLAERSRVSKLRKFPVGLSVLAVGRKRGDTLDGVSSPSPST
jgi:ubiquinone/menaquinone biosynthesis C-methylase UbiE